MQPDTESTRNMKRLMQHNTESTRSTKHFMHSDPEIECYCEDIHRYLEPGGCYNVQLIKTADGRVLCFEVNPRISTTFCMVIRAGFDPFKFFCKGMSAENRLGRVPDIRLVRHWINEFVKAD